MLALDDFKDNNNNNDTKFIAHFSKKNLEICNV